MKSSLYIALIAVTGLFACHKSTPASNPSLIGTWVLAQKDEDTGPNDRVLTPSADSAVLLTLNASGNYNSKLDNQIVSQGSYSTSTGTPGGIGPVLQLNDFNTTGIFSLPTLVEFGANGQIVSTFNGMFISISHDTLSLSSPLTPGGGTIYYFIRQ